MRRIWNVSALELYQLLCVLDGCFAGLFASYHSGYGQDSLILLEDADLCRYAAFGAFVFVDVEVPGASGGYLGLVGYADYLMITSQIAEEDAYLAGCLAGDAGVYLIKNKGWEIHGLGCEGLYGEHYAAHFAS